MQGVYISERVKITRFIIYIIYIFLIPYLCNVKVSYLIVDEMHHEHPELIRDQYWDEIFPTELPYTVAAQAFREEHPQPSTAGIQLSAAQQELQPSTAKIDDMAADFPQKFRSDVADDAESGIHFIATGKMSRLVVLKLNALTLHKYIFYFTQRWFLFLFFLFFFLCKNFKTLNQECYRKW